MILNCLFTFSEKLYKSGTISAIQNTSGIYNLNEEAAMQDENLINSMEEQLQELYHEKEVLNEQLGVSSAEAIIQMVQSLEAQLNDLYYNKENQDSRELEIRVEGDNVIIYGPKNISIRKKM